MERKSVCTPVKSVLEKGKRIQNLDSPFYHMPSVSTPPSRFMKIKNPFEHSLTEKLHTHFMSPSIMLTSTTNPKVEEKFKWNIDDISCIKPADIDEASINQHEQLEEDPMLESYAQANIDRFFSLKEIVPSPFNQSVKTQPLLLDKSTSSPDPRAYKNCSSQTVLTLPPTLPKELEEALKPYFTYTEDQQGSESKNKSWYRKLFEFNDHHDDSTESICSSPARSLPSPSLRLPNLTIFTSKEITERCDFETNCDIFQNECTLSPIVQSPTNLSAVRRNLSPRRRNLSPGRRNLSPGRSNFSPGRVNLSPGRRNLSPAGGNMGSERRNLTPGRQNLSPGRSCLGKGAFSPQMLQNRASSPGSHSLSPVRQQLSPDRINLSPIRQAPVRRSRSTTSLNLSGPSGADMSMNVVPSNEYLPVNYSIKFEDSYEEFKMEECTENSFSNWDMEYKNVSLVTPPSKDSSTNEMDVSNSNTPRSKIFMSQRKKLSDSFLSDDEDSEVKEGHTHFRDGIQDKPMSSKLLVHDDLTDGGYQTGGCTMSEDSTWNTSNLYASTPTKNRF